MAVTEKTAVSLARDVYYDAERPPLPNGWTVFLNCTSKEEINGYFGAAYQAKIDSRHASIVIAHRGSDSGQDWVEDFAMWATNKVPDQFYTGAIPFIQNVFLQLDKTGYNQTVTYLYFTGHSLGATLAELSIIRYIHYFDPERFTYNPYRIWGNATYVFESPGSLNLAAEQLNGGEIGDRDIIDGGDTIQVYNSEVDAINTCMPTSASYGRRRIFAAIGNYYECLNQNETLSYHPGVYFYGKKYTLTQHKKQYVYNWVTQVFNRSDPNTYSAIRVSEWPIGNDAAFYNYKSYYAVQNYNFQKHNRYWEQYTSILWDQNPSLHKEFNNDLSAFQDYYYKTELNYIALYPGNIDASYLLSQNGFVIEAEIPYELQIDSYSISGVGDVNGDKIPDLLIGLYYVNGYAGEAYLVYGGQNGTIYLSTFPSAQGFNIKGIGAVSSFASRTGTAVSGVGDVNGDDIPDMLISAPVLSRIYLVYGGQEGTIDLSTFSSAQGFVMQGLHGFTGTSISAIGDVSGDGIPDILIGDPYLAGIIYVVYGGRIEGVIDLTQFPNAMGHVIKGSSYEYAYEQAGTSVSGIGDVDGDNIPDILIGAPGKRPGRAYVVSGKCRGTIELSTFPNACGFIIEGDADWPGFGRSVSGIGDANRDGIPDFLVGGAFTGKPQYCPDPSGYKAAAWLIYGGQWGTIDLATLKSYQGIKIVSPYCKDWTTTYSTDQVGGIVSGMGDVNKDGVPDFLVSFTSEDIVDTPDQALAYLVYGGFNGTVDLATFPSERGFIIKQSIDGCLGMDGCGGGGHVSASAVGDVDRDGTPDIFVGVSRSTTVGKNYLIYGRDILKNTVLESDKKEKSSKSVQKKANNSTTAVTKTDTAQNSNLNFFLSSGKQFNIFYQQAKDYLASFWNFSWYNSPENKERALSLQEQKRLDQLDKVQITLEKLEHTLETTTHDNKAYLTKVLTFYKRMVAKWQKNVVEISAQDIRDLQADIATIKDAVYFGPLLAEFGIEKVVRKPTIDNSVGFFAPVNASFMANQHALAAQPLPALRP